MIDGANAKKQEPKINPMNVEFNICDIECLWDYFSLQFRTHSMEKARLIECTKNADFFKLYKQITNAKFPMYFFSINYDATMLNAMMKIIEKMKKGKEIHNINRELRKISNYMISGVNYFKLNKEFWVDLYFKLEPDYDDDFELYKDCIQLLIQRHANEKNVCDFIDEYYWLFGQSPNFKKLNIIEIPKMLYYYTIRKDGNLYPSISLKNLQLIEEGHNIKFDFTTYNSISKIKADGKYDLWVEYSLNDVDFLYRYFLKHCLPIIETRIYATMVIKKFNPDFEIKQNMIHSENNTNLLVGAFRLPDDKINKNVKIDYTEHIKTNHEKFNNLVEFANKHKDIKKDKTLKEKFCAEFEKEYVDDDKLIYFDGEVFTKAGEFDEIKIGNYLHKVGLGGIHHGIENIIATLLYHLDFVSQYPSIILEYEEYFKNIINVDFYKILYKFRNEEIKPKLKSKDLTDEERQELKRLEKGVKLLLNTLYGLINSEFKLPVACKTLGRFICLKGQSMLINLMDKLHEKHEKVRVVNSNTDGIIVDNIPEAVINEICNESDSEYFKVGVDKIEKLIQNNVNNYLKFSNGEMKPKGNAFKTGLKHQFANDEKLAVNMANALCYLKNEPEKVKIRPIYFKQKQGSKHESSINLEGECSSINIPYYLTNKENGTLAIKNIKHPMILGIDNEPYYLTTDESKADLKVYQYFGRMMEKKILEFSLNETGKPVKYREFILTPDTDKENISNKRRLKKLFGKCFDANRVCMNGWGDSMSNIVTVENTSIKELVNYTMSEIQASTIVKGFSVKNDGVICLATDNKEDMEKLDQYNTFNVGNYDSKNKLVSKLYVFERFEVDITKEFPNTTLLINDYVPICDLPMPKPQSMVKALKKHYRQLANEAKKNNDMVTWKVYDKKCKSLPWTETIIWGNYRPEFNIIQSVSYGKEVEEIA